MRIRPQRKSKIPDLFQRKLVITLPRWSPLVLAGGVIVGMLDRLTVLTDVISVLAATAAVLCAVKCQRQLIHLRRQVHSTLHNIDNDDPVISSIYSDDTPPQRVRFSTVNGSKTGVS